MFEDEVLEKERKELAAIAATLLPDQVAKLVDFIPVRKYLDLYGETKAAVDMRIARGHWRKGVEFTVPKGGGLWISLRAVNDWAKA